MAWGDTTDRIMRSATRTFGRSVTYVPAVGASYTIANAIFDATFEGVDPNTGAIIQSLNPRLGVRVADMQAAPAEGDRVIVGSDTYRVKHPEPDGWGGLTLQLHKATGNEVVITCARPLDAGEAEVLESGATEKLTMTEADQAFSLSVVAGAVDTVYAGAFPADTMTQAGQTIDISAGIVGVRLDVTSLPTAVAATVGAGIALSHYSPDFTKVQTVLLTAQADGTALLQVFGTGVPSVDTSFVVPPEWIGTYWNPANGQWGYLVDGVDQGYVGSFAGGTERVPVLQVIVPDGTDEVFDGLSVSGKYVTYAGDMGAGWPAGTADPCGSAI